MSGTTFVVGFDPGLSCGWAAFRDVTRVAYGQGPCAEAIQAVVAIVRPVVAERPKVFVAIACERFVLLPTRPGQRSAQPDALEAIGSLRTEAHELGVPVMLQSPADADRFDELMIEAGLRLTGAMVGQRDADDVNSAQRHALLWVAKHRASMLPQLLAKRG